MNNTWLGCFIFLVSADIIAILVGGGGGSGGG